MSKSYSFKRWTRKEIKFLKDNYQKLNLKQLTQKLNRSYSSISNKLFSLKYRFRKEENFKFNLTETQKAYLAGLIDGEGYIGFNLTWRNKIPQRAVPIIVIGNRDKRIIDFVQQTLSTGSRWSENYIISNDYRYKKEMKHYEISISGRARIKNLLIELFPYLISKKELANLIIYFINQHKSWTPYELENWKIILKVKELIGSLHATHTESFIRLKNYVKNLQEKV